MKENISEHFKLSEFKVSSERPDLAEKIEITKEIEDNLFKLSNIVLEPIRNLLNEPITILSGVRSKELNKAIGGSNTSDHMNGMASDLTSIKIRTNEEKVAKDIWNLNINEIRQIIYYPNNGFIHVSINTNNKPYKHELLESKNNKYKKIK